MRGKPPLTLPDDARKRAIASIQRFFRDDLDHEIGDLKASTVLDYFLVELGPAVYNKAVVDATTFFAERSQDLGALAVELGPAVYNKAVVDATTFFAERSQDLGALAYQEEFPYWPAAARRRP